MQSELPALTIKRVSNCDLAGEPSIHVLLLSGECPIMEYFASSLADALCYKEETLRVITHRHFRRADQGDAADFGAPLARERNL